MSQGMQRDDRLNQDFDGINGNSKKEVISVPFKLEFLLSKRSQNETCSIGYRLI